MWQTRVTRTRSAWQRSRSRGLVSWCTEAMESSPADGVNDGARDVSLHARCCIPFQYPSVCVYKHPPPPGKGAYCKRLLQYGYFYQHCTNALARRLEGNVGKYAGVGKETAWQKCEGGISLAWIIRRGGGGGAWQNWQWVLGTLFWYSLSQLAVYNIYK
jgi:hypothetical protein